MFIEATANTISYCIHVVVNHCSNAAHKIPLSWCSHLEFLPLIPMLPNRGWDNKLDWFLFAKCLLASINVIGYEDHDQDGGSMIKLYIMPSVTFMSRLKLAHDKALKGNKIWTYSQCFWCVKWLDSRLTVSNVTYIDSYVVCYGDACFMPAW